MNMARVLFLVSKTFALFALLTCYAIFATSSSSTFLFERTANKRFTNVTATFSRNSEIQCGRLCTKSEWCDLFNYHPSSTTCQLCPFFSGNADLVVEEHGWDMFYAADGCLSSPCLNSATCTDTIGSFECTCAFGYGGTNCEIVTSCLPDWKRSQNSCYLVDETLQTVDQARVSCSERFSTAHLVYIKAQEEQEFLEDLLQDAITGNGVWLGATYDASSNQFLWNDGTTLSYSTWGQGEPNGMGSEHSVCAWRANGFLWADAPSSFLLSSVCEYEIA